MQIFKIIIPIFIITYNFTFFASSNVRNNELLDIQEQIPSQCDEEGHDKDKLTINWYTSDPYQFSYISKNGNYGITGFDIELINRVSSKVGINIKYVNSIWNKSIENIRTGKSDIVPGATYTDERAAFANFSIPYRFEEISLFVLPSVKKQLNFNNVNEFLAQIRLLNFRVGVMQGFVYGNTTITDYLNEKSNNDIIIKYESNAELLNALIHKEIDGFLADRITGVALILGYKGEQIEEIYTDIKTPLHLMFSKTTVSSDLVEQYNTAIKNFIDSDDYKKLIKSYVYYVLLPKSIDSTWCDIIGFMGSITFAISGIVIAAHRNSTLFSTFLLAISPSIIGCVLFDITINQVYNAPFTLTPTYIYRIFITVLIGFSTLKLFDYYNNQTYQDNFASKILNNIIVICDTLGQAFFMVIGVVIVVIQKIEPLEFWGPCFALITSSGGVLLRNIICNYGNITKEVVPKEINFEVFILWGIVFIILLNIYAYSPSYSTIKYSMIIVIAGAVVSRLLIYYYNISNLTFRVDNVESEKDIAIDKK
ncbi:MAG: transporter substrate-binding domain-containing protein [Candidatus Rickettsia vulgarisii]